MSAATVSPFVPHKAGGLGPEIAPPASEALITNQHNLEGNPCADYTA
jgi:hypothetical protein